MYLPARRKVLPTDSSVWTLRNGLNGQISDSLGKALLLLAGINHYADYRDEDINSKLKWHTIAVSAFISHSIFVTKS